MGEIVFWTIVRTAIMIPIIWFSQDYFDYKFWWMISALALYGVIVHPVIYQYKKYAEANKNVMEGTLCSSCKHFEKGSVMCLKHDTHPTEEYLPCNGEGWEPK